MLAEAVARHGLNRAGLAHRLQRQRQLIASLTEHHKVLALIRALAVHVEPVTLTTLEQAASLATQYQLLTNDSLTLAVMAHLRVRDLATNDDDFDTAGVTVWQPR